MANIVLLHGAYQGGWIWQNVVPHLRAAGHNVFAPTLDGCAERRATLVAVREDTNAGPVYRFDIFMQDSAAGKETVFFDL